MRCLSAPSWPPSRVFAGPSCTKNWPHRPLKLSPPVFFIGGFVFKSPLFDMAPFFRAWFLIHGGSSEFELLKENFMKVLLALALLAASSTSALACSGQFRDAIHENDVMDRLGEE